MTLFQAKAKLVDDMKLHNFSENTIRTYYLKCVEPISKCYGSLINIQKHLYIHAKHVR